MSRKSKVDPVEKIKAVESILSGECGITDMAKKLGVDFATVASWKSIYLSSGPTALKTQLKNTVYSKELKLSAVTDYLAGNGSLMDICTKYSIRDTRQLRYWIRAYNTHGELKSRGSGGGSYMRKARKTTQHERLEIVQYCLDNDNNYGAAALKYNCSYQQVRSWVLQYKEMGYAGLEDRRGRRAGSEAARTPEEEMRDKIAELERRNKDLQMENDLLKKVRELEMKDRYL